MEVGHSIKNVSFQHSASFVVKCLVCFIWQLITALLLALSSHYYILQVERGLKFISSGLTLHHISGKLITIGGGGNCYSFGTHFNTMCVLSK